MPFIHSRSLEIANRLHAQIEAGAYKPGDRIPSTAALSTLYGIPLAAARGALHLLCRDGILTAHSQLGHFVAARDGQPVKPHISMAKKIADDLRTKITSGVYKPAQKIPSLRELARDYEVSTQPVRHAIDRLVDERLLTVVPREGTFVAIPQGKDSA